MHEPLVTVIIPTRNRLNFLKEALASILSQTYRNLEIIIQDNNCNDGTAEYIQKICEEDSRVIYQHSSIDLTMLENWNAAAKNMHGEYFFRFDDDNILLNYFVEFVIEKMQKLSLDYFTCLPFYINYQQKCSFYMFEPDEKTYLLSQQDILLFESEAWFDSNYTMYRMSTVREMCLQEGEGTNLYDTTLPDRNLTYRLVMRGGGGQAAVSTKPMGITRLGHLFSYSIFPSFSVQRISCLKLNSTDCHCCYEVERLNALTDTLCSTQNGRKLLSYYYKTWQSKASVNAVKYSDYLRCINKNELNMIERIQLFFMYLNLCIYVVAHLFSKYRGTTILQEKFIVRKLDKQNKLSTTIDDCNHVVNNIKNTQEFPYAVAKFGRITSYLRDIHIL